MNIQAVNPAVMGKQNWAVLLCGLKDEQGGYLTSRTSPDHFVKLFSSRDTDSLNDYWLNVSYGKINLDGFDIYGWEELPYTISQFGQHDDLSWFARSIRVQRAIDHFHNQKQVDFSKYTGVLVVTDRPIDLTGGYGIKDWNQTMRGVICWQDHFDTSQDPWSPHNRIAHEMGHAFTLHHSWNKDGVEYGDLWDVMSVSNVIDFNSPTYGASGPGLNAVNLLRLNWITQDRIWKREAHTGDSTVNLFPINHWWRNGFLCVEIEDYLFEFRNGSRWDQGDPTPRVLVHTSDDGYRSIIHQALSIGDTFTISGLPGLKELGYLGVKFTRVDLFSGAAVLEIINIPTNDWVDRLNDGQPKILAWIIEGVLGIGKDGKIVPVPPREPVREILVGLAVHELAEQVDIAEEKEFLQKAGLEMISRVANRKLRGSE